MNSGRLVIKCGRAENVRRKDQILNLQETRISPYLRVSHTTNSSFPEKKSSIQENVGGDFSFDNEIITFDYQGASSFTEENEVLKLLIQLVDSKDELVLALAEELPLIDVIEKSSCSDSSCVDWTLPLLLPGDTSANSQLHISTQFCAAKLGIVSLAISDCKLFDSVLNAEDRFSLILRNEEHGEETQRLTDIQGMTTGCINFEGDLHFWIEENSAFDYATLEIRKRCLADGISDVHSDDTLIGTAKDYKLTLANPTMMSKMGESGMALVTLPIKSSKGENIGTLNATRSFVGAKKLIINVKEVKELIVARKDAAAYVKLELRGTKHPVVSKKTKTVQLQGSSIQGWNDTISLPYVDQKELYIVLFDNDPLRNGAAVIGSATLSLEREMLNNTSTGSMMKGDFWKTLGKRNEFDVVECTGKICLTLSCESRLQEADSDSPSGASTSKATSSASETEENDNPDFLIKKSFQQLDLDKNGYIGASEIKHVLICMGEAPTDEEIDQMLAMLDFNGDGQVSFREFALMVKDPNPADEEFPDRARKALADQPSSPNHNTSIRKEEIQRRRLKRLALSSLVKSNMITIHDLKAFWLYIINGSESNNELSASYQQFCAKMPKVKDSVEARRVFDLLANETDKVTVDARELILSLANFVAEATPHDRVQLMFDLYDIDKTGALSMKDLQKVLVANHLTPAVHGKVRTLQKCTGGGGGKGGSIQKEELLCAASKCPNLLLPRHDLGTTSSAL